MNYNFEHYPYKEILEKCIDRNIHFFHDVINEKDLLSSEQVDNQLRNLLSLFGCTFLMEFTLSKIEEDKKR